MKEEKEEGKPEPAGEPGPKPAEGPQLEAVEESQLEAVEAPSAEPAEGTQLEAVEKPGLEAVEGDLTEPVEGAHTVEGDQGTEPEAAEFPKPEESGEPERSVEEALELDRMEVKAEEETPQEPAVAEEEVVIEPPVPAQQEAAQPGILALLARYWIWIVASLLGLSLVSAALLLVMSPEEEREEVKLGKRVHVVTASLGGEHYVNFNLWGPFRDAKGLQALRRGMPKIKHDLILSGGLPEVVRSIQENDLYYLEWYILGVVSRATGITVDQLDLKGLSVTRYSDEAEVGEEG